MEPISGKVLGATEKVSYFLGGLHFQTNPFFIIDIVIVTIIFYWVYIFLKETRAIRILYGILLLLIVAVVGNLLNLVLLNWILKSLTAMLIVAIPVVFQPELRTALERLGRSKLLGEFGFSKEESVKVLDEILQSVDMFSNRKIGALIVLKRQDSLREYIDNGIALDAKVSSEVLRSIFFPKSPLHDGAIIVKGDRILSACSILPVSQADIDSTLGTRHKAALGVTEDSDAISIVVSEETGQISLAVNGKLETKIPEDRLRNRLVALSRQKR